MLVYAATEGCEIPTDRVLPKVARSVSNGSNDSPMGPQRLVDRYGADDDCGDFSGEISFSEEAAEGTSMSSASICLDFQSTMLQ